MQANIPLRVRSTTSGSIGTLVSNQILGNSKERQFIHDRLITGITYTSDLARIRLSHGQITEQKDVELRVFKSLAQAGISVDFINVQPEVILFTVPADLATRALALAERYVDYRVALGTLKAPRPDDPTALRNSLNARERLRERYFAPEEHEALFARESALDRYTLARLEIQHNTGLTAEEKARALKDAEAELPPEQRADRAHAVAHLGAAVQTQDFEARGVDDRTRYQLRSATYGTDAAQALARLDHEERAWNQKLDDYAAAKAQAHDPGQMQALRERLFTPQEQLRLEAALALRQSQR